MSSGGSNGLERDELLQQFVPVHVFSYSSVRRMKEQDIGLRRVVCDQCNYQTHKRWSLVRHTRTHTVRSRFSVKRVKRVLVRSHP